MIKKILYIFLGLCLLGLFVGTTGYLYQKSQKPPVIFETVSPTTGNIEKVTVASGTILPRQEIQIKPKISGIIAEIFVQAGDQVKKGTVLAKTRIVPNLVNVNEAENRLNKAQISYTDAKRELDRQEKAFKQDLIAEAEITRLRSKFEAAAVDLEAAQNNVRLLKEGAAKPKSEADNTLIPSTVAGMVLEIPVKVGDTVVETSALNAGTTVAIIADMNALIFEGKIDETEVGNLHENMPLELTIGAIEGQTFPATLEYIAPKGTQDREGAVQFVFKAAVEPADDVLIRAGYSANAKIVLDKRENVLTLSESLIQYDKAQKPYVEVETGPQQFERRDLQLGLSDGMNVEILSGLALTDKVKKPQPVTEKK